MEQIKLGIDNGNYNTKSSDHLLYPSGFTVQDTEFIVPDQQLYYGGRYYAIGDCRMSFQQDKTGEDDIFLLSLPMLAHAMKRSQANEAEFVLGVGLPIEWFGMRKAAFRQYFLRDWQEFQYEGEPYRALIRDCQVFPQGYAALCNAYAQFRQSQSITMIDIGGYTVDVMTVVNDKPSRSSCMSLRKGTILLLNAIRSILQQRNINLSDELIADGINGRMEHKEREWILDVTAAQVQAYLKDLLNALRERGLDLSLPIAFAGGGAELLRAELADADVNVTAVLDRFANADGFKALLRP